MAAMSLGRTPLAFGLALFVALACPARAEVRLGPEAVGGGNYAVNVMTWWEIPFRSIVRQRYDFSCGSAAIATLLTHQYGIPTAERGPFMAMWNAGNRELIKKAGFSMLDMKSYLQARGFTAEGYRLTVDDLAKVAQPSIVLINLDGFKHFVVVKGVRNGQILVGDPVRGLNRYSYSEFGKYWNGIALAISKAPDKRPGWFNLARDWNPYATAPIEANAQTASIGDLTSHLPQAYQVTTQILLDVRVGTVQ
jgi:uncharacterized protein